MRLKYFLTIISFLLFLNILFAQSDYELVQSFKSKVSQLQLRITEAESMEEINNIAKDIELLKSQFTEHKELVDKSLYPDDFNKSFAKLKTDLDVRSTDFTHIDVLQTEVVALKDEVDRLSEKNNELINQIAILETGRIKDAETIKKLGNLVANLKASLLKRDNLILSIADSLIPQLTADVSLLTTDDKQKITAQIEKNKVLLNVKRSLRDHVRFLDVTSLKPEDLKEIKRQQNEFAGTWQKIGVNLVEVYAAKVDKSNELKEIDTLFNNWQAAIRDEAWYSIKEEFAMNSIFLQDFGGGQEFTVEITRFIDEELKNFGVKSQEESEKIYTSFADSTWFKSIQTEWMPYLIDNTMLTVQQKELIESKISEWKSVVFPRDITWVYYVVALIVIAALVFFFFRKKPKHQLAKDL
ncbi:MAG: hypothetical protein MUO34_14370 [Ignavibacteriaceae bacterium]|nr:hypothetical protein [Ignavibacteriaceae bacterium]